jgi:hypothetical protein
MLASRWPHLTALAQCLVGTSGLLFSVMVIDGRQTGAKYHSTIETEVKNA